MQSNGMKRINNMGLLFVFIRANLWLIKVNNMNHCTPFLDNSTENFSEMV